MTPFAAERKWMTMAIDLAKRGAGRTDPNPMVGAVLVRDGVCIGSGWHQKCGEPHAERNALADCRSQGNDPAGATLYVTLEPCCHYGATPPCTQAIIEHRLARVVVGSRDPNPLVSGKGVQTLEAAGIPVTTDFLRDECDALNPVFFHYITTGTPYVVLKYAMTLDGKIATRTGASQWITGPAAREQVHRERDLRQAILTGIGTVLRDDPLLTCRLPGEGHRDPIRIICDTQLRTPLRARVVTTARQTPTILATACEDPARHAPYLAAGCTILVTPTGADGHLDLPALMRQLAAQKISSILLEGGGVLNWSALSAGIVQRVQTYIAPKLFGGAQAPSPVGGTGVELPSDAFQLKPVQVTRIGEDLLLESEVISCSQASSKRSAPSGQ